MSTKSKNVYKVEFKLRAINYFNDIEINKKTKIS